MERLYPESKVEVRGWEARHYDLVMNAVSLGTYGPFIRRSIQAIGLRPGERVMIFGAGAGRNAELMLKDLGPTGHITAWEIGEDMREGFQRRLGDQPNVELLDRRIDEPTDPPEQPYDHVVICFVLHGLPQDARLKVLENARRLLRPGGQFQILDYTQGPAAAPPWYRRIFLTRIECPLAVDYVNRDWDAVLTEAGFEPPRHRRFMRDVVTLLSARRPAESAPVH